MKTATLYNYKWETTATVEDPFSDPSIIALNGLRIGKTHIIEDNYDFMEIRDELVEEFTKENPGFLVRESILVIKDFDPEQPIQ